MNLPGVRGILLEEIVLHLLVLVGYRIVKAGEEGTRAGPAGLEIRGRGVWHQIDALAAFDRTPAFMYPLRLMVEAKCYASTRTGVEIVRNTVGTQKDISENYFSYRTIVGDQDTVQAPRFNYHSALFSSSGYTPRAQRYAIAHQIFLIQYQRVAVIEPVIKALLRLRSKHLKPQTRRGRADEVSHRIRQQVRQVLGTAPEFAAAPRNNPFSDEGWEHIRGEIIEPLLRIRGSYFGMLQGKWPMHLLSRDPLPRRAFEGRDEIRCRVYRLEGDRWAFSPSNVSEADASWFALEFDIPEEIAGLVDEVRRDAVALANVKLEQFSFLDLAGKIGGVNRQVRLVLDEDWLERYLARVREPHS